MTTRFLYPFVEPPIGNIDHVVPFNLGTPSIGSASHVPHAIRFSAPDTFNLLAPTGGIIFVASSILQKDDPNQFSDLLLIEDPPPPACSEYGANDLVDLVLIPSPFQLEFINTVLSRYNRPSLTSIRFGGVPIPAIVNSTPFSGNPNNYLAHSLAEHKLIVVDDAGNITDFDGAARMDYFVLGRYSVTVPGGTVLATVNSSPGNSRTSVVSIFATTDAGFMDPMDLYALFPGVFQQVYNDNDLVELTTKFPLSVDSNPDDYNLIDKNAYTSATYLDFLVRKYPQETVYEDFRLVQKANFLSRLHAIGDPDGDGSYRAIKPNANPYREGDDPADDRALWANQIELRRNWFRNWDWQNIFQLEAVCEFYMNFHFPRSGGFPRAVPTLTEQQDASTPYRWVNFDSDWVISRRVDLDENDPNSEHFIADTTYPKYQFPYVFVLIDDFSMIGGDVNQDYHPAAPADGRPPDGYRGMLFVVERFQSLTTTGDPVGYPRVIGQYPWTSHSSQRHSTVEARSSIAGNVLYIAYSQSALNERHNFCFQVGNSYHIRMIPEVVKPSVGALVKYGGWVGSDSFTSPLPGINDPLAHIVDASATSTVDSNGKGSILFHRGLYGTGVNGTGSEGCNVSPIPKFLEMRKNLIRNYLSKYDPDESIGRYNFIRTIMNTNTQAASEALWQANPSECGTAASPSWRTDFNLNNALSPNFRCLYFLVRPDEPNLV